MRIYSCTKYRRLSKWWWGARIQEKQKLYKKVNSAVALLGLIVNSVYMI